MNKKGLKESIYSQAGARKQGETIENQRLDAMVYLGAKAFEEIDGEVVQSVALVLEKDE
jgi:hypothetical protein